MDWIAIRQEYESSEITLKELATKHGISEGTMRSRKNREKWQRNERGQATRNATENATQGTKQRATKKKNVATRDTASREPKIKVIVNNRETKVDESLALTEKQVLFVAEYLIDFNATRAAMAVGYSKKTARTIGWENLTKPDIQKEIARQKDIVVNSLGITTQRVLLEYLKIAFADITQYTEFGQNEEYVYREGQKVKGKNGEYLKHYVNYINIKDHDKVDGSLISEVKEGKEGISIKLYDKMKALEVLAKHLDLLPDKHKRKIEDEKLKLDQAKFEADKLKASGGGGVDENIQKIQTLASLLNNPAQNRSIRDFENDE